MLTIFTCPKPFRDHIGIIQRNAIQSWKLLDPAIEIILFGDEEGTAHSAKEFGLRHIADIEINRFGTPLLNDVFRKAHNEARNDILCYVNSDIILLRDFFDAVLRARSLKENFLLVGQRWDVSIDFPWNFTASDWEEKIRQCIKGRGKLHPGMGSDFFVFSHDLFLNIPPFAVGRAGWDNWMIYHGISMGIPVIDVTPVATVIHQNHDYCHVKLRTNNNYENPESMDNRKIMGTIGDPFILDDVSHILTSKGLKRNLIKRMKRCVKRQVKNLRTW
jgi:hypothetical protein